MTNDNLIIIKLESCDENTDGAAWYAYFKTPPTAEDLWDTLQILKDGNHDYFLSQPLTVIEAEDEGLDLAEDELFAYQFQWAPDALSQNRWCIGQGG